MPEFTASRKTIRKFAIIAGSGFQSFANDSVGREIKTEFGAPSSPVRELQYGVETVFLLARHGDSMLIPPHAINYRANLKALQQLGVSDVLAMNTVGIVVADGHPGQIVVPDQIIDYTYGRDHSIYGMDSATLDHIAVLE